MREKRHNWKKRHTETIYLKRTFIHHVKRTMECEKSMPRKTHYCVLKRTDIDIPTLTYVKEVET